MPLPEGFIEEIKFKNDITDVISSYVNLKRRGRNFVGLCPFHGEKTPSFNVYPQSNSFYCFGCGVGGDIITFVEKIENLDYFEAVKFLAQKAGIQMPENNKREQEISNIKMRIFEINRESARFFHENLYSEKGKVALEYLRKRCLSDRIIKKFGLGYSPNSRYELINHLKAKGFKYEEMVNANLAYVKGNSYVSARFFDRVMFPIIDLRGNVIAFGGRIMSDQKPKYLNTSDTLAFKKSLNLFSLNFAKAENNEFLILVEGYMDVIALFQAGFKNAVATLGTALTTEQAGIMSRYAKEVVICYDSDEAGQKAASRAIELLRPTGVLIKVISVPDGKDPDEFIRTYGNDGAIRFAQLIKNSGNDIEYRLQKVARNYNLNESDGKIAYLKDAVKILASLDDLIEQEIYAGKLSEKLNVAKDSIMRQVEKEKRKRRKINDKKQFLQVQQNLSAKNDKLNVEKFDNLRAATAEEAIIAYIINNPESDREIFSRLSGDDFCTSFNRKIYSVLQNSFNCGKQFSLTDLTQDFSREEVSAIAAMLAKEAERMSSKEAVFEYVNVLLFESEKLDKNKIVSADDKEIMEYMKLLREHKK